MNLLLVVLYILVGLFLGGVITREIKANKTWSISIWVHAWLLIYYSIIPIIMLISAISTGMYLGVWKDVVIVDNFYVNYNTLLAVVLFLISFSYVVSLKFALFKVEARVLTFGEFHVPVLKIVVFGAICLSIFSLFFYVNAFGGLIKTFKIAPYIASTYHKHLYADKFQGVHTLFKRFIPLAIYPILLAGFYKKKTSLILLVFIPLLVYIYFTFLERQRQVTLVLLLIPILGYQVNQNKFISPRFLFWTGVAMLLFPVITFLNKAFVFNKESYDTITGWFTFNKYIREFNFPQIALWLSQKAEYEKFILSDFYVGIFGNYLPTSFKPDQTVNDLNSYLFEGKGSTSFPPGVIGNGFYHMGYVGVIFWGALLGTFVNLTDTLFKSLITYDRRYSFAYIYCFVAFFAYIRTGVLGYSLYRPSFVFFILILIFSHVFVSQPVVSKRT